MRAAILALLACACASAPAMPSSSTSPLLGRQAPLFHRPTLAGPRFELPNGQLTAVEFFAAYCIPCQERLPAAEQLHRELPDLEMVGISVDPTVDGALEQVRRYHLDFPIVHDGGNVLAGRFRVTELPIALLVDGGGRVIWVGGPDQPADALRRAALAARAGKR